MVTMRSALSTGTRSAGPRVLPEMAPSRFTAIQTSSSGRGGATGVSVCSETTTPASRSVLRRAVVEARSMPNSGPLR